MSHVLDVAAFEYLGSVRLDCSCGWSSGDVGFITLDELNKIAHEHIEAAERDISAASIEELAARRQVPEWAVKGYGERPMELGRPDAG